MNNNQLLQLKIESDDHPSDMTIGGYFEALLTEVWREGESFSGKRPFGNSGWEYDLYYPLVKAGAVKGSLDEGGCPDDFDRKAADRLIFALIKASFHPELLEP